MVCRKYEVKIGKLLAVILIEPKSLGLSYWLIESELLVIQALVIGYLGICFWLLNQEYRSETPGFVHSFGSRYLVFQSPWEGFGFCF